MSIKANSRQHKYKILLLLGIVSAVFFVLNVRFTEQVKAETAVCTTSAGVQNGISVAPSHGQSFYIDTGASPKLDAGYVGYRVTNNTGSTQNDLWTEAANFTGGVLGLSNALDRYQRVRSLNTGTTSASYFLLKANAATTTPQTHHLKVWDGRPDLPSSTMLYDCVYTFTSVKETIKAAANKVSDTGYGLSAAIEVSNTTPEVGQTITISVEGSSGTIGAGASPDGSIVWLTPAAVSSWPTRSLRLESVSVTFERGSAWSGGNSSLVTYTDQLMISNAQDCLKKGANTTTCTGGTGNASAEYRAFYTFRVVGVPTSTVKAVPVAQIASGTQIKHADITGAGSTIDIGFSSVAINASLTKSVTNTTGLQTVMCGSSCIVPGGANGATYAAVPYRLTASSTTATSVAVDEIVDRPQSGVIYKPGSARITDIGRTNTSINDPSYIDSEAELHPRPLHFIGPFNLSSSTTANLDYQMWVPVGSYTNTAFAKIGDLLIGASASSMSKVEVTSDGSGTVGVVNTTEDLGIVATTEPASNVTSSAAVINGTVDPNGANPLTAQFQYASNPSFSGSTTVIATTPTSGSLNGLSTPTNVSFNLTGLSSNTTYYYRVIAGSAQGEVLSFTTDAVLAPPTVTTTSATGISSTAATLNGTINPNLTNILLIRYIYGTDATLSSGATTLTLDDGAGGNLTASGSSTQPFSATVTGLTASATYYYKIRACTTSNCSTFYDGSITSFTAQNPPTNPVLGVIKTEDDADNIVTPGQSITYTVRITNTGGSTGTTSFIDTIPSGMGTPSNLTYTNCGSASSNYSAPNLTISSLTVTTSNSCIVTYTVAVNTPLNEGMTLTNSVDVAAANEGGNNPAAVSSSTLTVNATPDLSTSTKSVTDNNGGTVKPGDTLTYMITLKNSGDGQASNVSVADTIDSDTHSLSNVTQANCGSSSNSSTGSQLNLTNISVSVGTHCIITFDVVVKSPLNENTAITNMATISASSEGGLGAAPSSSTLYIDATPNLVVTHSENDPDDIVHPNQSIGYTIKIQNNGDGQSSGIAISSIVSSYMVITPESFTITSCGSPTNSSTSGNVNLSGITIGSGSTCIIMYDAAVKSTVVDGTVIESTVDVGQASEGGNTPAPSSANALTVSIIDNPSGTHFLSGTTDLSCSGISATNSLRIAWNSVSQAARYEVLLDGSTIVDAASNTFYDWTLPAVDGTHTFAVRSIDSYTNASSWSADCSVTLDQTAPTVTAGSDQTKRSGFNQIDSSATDSTSGIARYDWTKVSGPGAISFTDPSTLHPDVSASADGTYVIELTVTDSAGNSATDTFKLIWDTTSPSVDAGFNKSANVSFTQTSASASDSLIGIASYSWSKLSGPGTVSFTTSADLKPQISASADGTYVLQLLITDKLGNSASDTFTLIWDKTAPAVDAGLDKTTSAVFKQSSASANDETSSLATYLWTKVSGPGEVTFNDTALLHPIISASANGTYVLRLTATDTVGNSASDTFTLIWATPLLTPNDDDGATDTEEQAAPNRGDANNDGLQDSEQKNVTSFLNPMTNSYAILENIDSCQNTNVNQMSTGDLRSADGNYLYPAGLMNFTLVCGNPGMTVRVNQYFYGITSTNVVARKYDSRTNTYSTIPSAEISVVTIDGQQVIKISYDITDGGPLDEDGEVNGTIVDPSGPAVLNSHIGVPNTGLAPQSLGNPLTSGAIGLFAWTVGFYLLRRKAGNRTI